MRLFRKLPRRDAERRPSWLRVAWIGATCISLGLVAVIGTMGMWDGVLIATMSAFLILAERRLGYFAGRVDLFRASMRGHVEMRQRYQDYIKAADARWEKVRRDVKLVQVVAAREREKKRDLPN